MRPQVRRLCSFLPANTQLTRKHNAIPSTQRIDEIDVLVATHVYATGPAHALAEYLRERVAQLSFLEQPFGYAPDVRPRLSRYRDGDKIARWYLPWPRGLPQPVLWLRDVVMLLLVGLLSPGKRDIVVCADGLLAATAVFLRRLGKARRVVLWTIDYAPERFESRGLNEVYHRIDRFCVTHCDETWNLSERMKVARRAGGIDRPQRHVPLGVTMVAPSTRRTPGRIVFVGHLLAKQGLQVVIEALPGIRRRVTGAHLLVVGDGPHREVLERLAYETGVADAVDFAGFVEDHAEIEARLAAASVGVATYDPTEAGFSAYADSGKVKTYLAAGLPVVVTRVAELADVLAEKGAGKVVEYDATAVEDALCELLSDETARSEAGLRAEEIARTFLWDEIFHRAFSRLLDVSEPRYPATS